MKVSPAAFFIVLLAAVAARADECTDRGLALVRSRDARQRAEGAALLGEARSPRDRERALRVLLPRLNDAVSTVRSAAATSLEKLGDRRAAPTLYARLDLERDARALAAVLLALGKLGWAVHADRVATIARSYPVPSVKAAAVTALASLGGPAARLTALELVASPGVSDPDWSLRAAALLALARCGEPDDVGAALVAYREGGGRHHWFARCSLARLLTARDPDPLPTLHRLVQDDDPRVALTAAIGIARRGNAAEMPALLRHRSPGVRAAAATAVGRERKEGAYARLRAMARFDKARRVRWAAALALFAVEDRLGDELVLAGLGSREPVVWAEAIAALVGRTGESHARDVDEWRDALRRWREQR